MKECIQCQTPFTPTGNAQKKCPACRDAALAPATDNASRQALVDYCSGLGSSEKLPHQATMDRLANPSFEKMAGDLMMIAGVKRMQLDFVKYKVTIELILPCD
jgi:hypothetical protein